MRSCFSRWYIRLRRPVQVLALCALCIVPWANARGWNVVSGNFFALNVAGLPFADPLGVLQLLVGGAVPGKRLWLGALLALGIALVLGRVFCSWVCPYGLLSECAHALRKRRRGLSVRDAPASHGKLFSPFALRLGVVVIGLAGTALLGFPVLNRLSMPGELSLAPLAAFTTTGMPEVSDVAAWFSAIGIPLLIGGVLLAEMLCGQRLWCRYLCPQSVCLGLAARCRPGGWGVRWTARSCICPKGSRPCRDACSLALDPRRSGGAPRQECTNCGDCVAACARYGGALDLGAGKQEHARRSF